MKLTVTRRQIIKALKTEPLMRGSFAHENDYDDDGQVLKTYKSNSKCAVCAVGSILDVSLGKRASEELISEIGSGITKCATLSDRSLLGEDDDSFLMDSSGYPSLSGIKKLAKLAAQKGMHMSALSMLFEGVSDTDHSKYIRNDGLANRKMREILVNFVKSNFPSKLVIDTKKVY